MVSILPIAVSRRIPMVGTLMHTVGTITMLVIIVMMIVSMIIVV